MERILYFQKYKHSDDANFEVTIDKYSAHRNHRY